MKEKALGYSRPSARTRLTATVMGVRSQRQALPKAATTGTTHTRDRGLLGRDRGRGGGQGCRDLRAAG